MDQLGGKFIDARFTLLSFTGGEAGQQVCIWCKVIRCVSASTDQGTG